jgi:hypothetical protein
MTEPPPPFTNTVKIDHNYNLSDALRYMTPGGSPICDAQIRVYKKEDYDAGLLDQAIGATLTRPDGRWLNPILVNPGYTYAIVFQKPNEYGPDKVEVVA